MINHGKKNILGVLINAVDYEYATKEIVAAAVEKRSLGVSALAVHGVMTGVLDSTHRYRLNNLHLVTPDGQPVRWLLNLLYGTALKDRVYGPRLTLKVVEEAAKEGLSIYLYGSSQKVLELLQANLLKNYPGLQISGAEPSRFRHLVPQEKAELVDRIRLSKAHITLIGLGCPRQEVFAFEYMNQLSMPLLAVGAAFDYHAGTLQEPPEILQRLGLQWLYRLMQDPKRLARRYLVLNAQFTVLALGQVLRFWHPNPEKTTTPTSEISFG